MLALQLCCPALHNAVLLLHALASEHSHDMMVLVLGVRSCPAVLQAAQVVRRAHAPEDPGGRGGGEFEAALPLLL